MMKIINLEYICSGNYAPKNGLNYGATASLDV